MNLDHLRFVNDILIHLTLHLFIHLQKYYADNYAKLLKMSHPKEFPIPFVGGMWMFSGISPLYVARPIRIEQFLWHLKPKILPNSFSVHNSTLRIHFFRRTISQIGSFGVKYYLLSYKFSEVMQGCHKGAGGIFLGYYEQELWLLLLETKRK